MIMVTVKHLGSHVLRRAKKRTRARTGSESLTEAGISQAYLARRRQENILQL